MGELENRKVMERWLKAITSLDADAAATLYTEDVVVEIPGLGAFEGRPAVRAHEGRFLGANDEYYVRPERIVAKGDDVVIHYTHGGRFNQDWNGLPANGKSWEVRGTNWLIFRDGKISRSIDTMDTAGLDRQLGASGQ